MPEKLDFDGLQRILWTFAQHRVVTSAARAGILGRLCEKPATTDEVAADLGLDPEACGKIVRALTALGLLDHRQGVFEVAVGLRPLFRPGSENLMPFLQHSHQMYDSWGLHLENWLRSGAWPQGQRTPEETQAFAGAMVAIGRQVALRVAPEIGLDGVGRMLDVGGGQGHWSEVFCNANPNLRATVFDIPPNAAAGTAKFAGTALAERIDFLGGDYLEDDFGGDYDLVLLANVLHQEDKQCAPQLIDRCAAALTRGGRLAIVDFRIDDDRCNHLFGALFAVHMRDFGDTWTENQTRRWMERAKIAEITTTDIGPDRWLITGTKF